MSNSICSKKGMTLIEVLIALMLLTVGVLGVVSLQPSGWRISTKSDFLGRAAGILHRELETSEVLIMNPNNPNPCALSNPVVLSRTVFGSGQDAAQPGDVAFDVQTTTTDLGDGSWRVTVTVTPPASMRGISDSIIVTRQEFFRQ
jgi:prepilin-type N-terminal cleavage/methylation domain-containing protein